MKKIIASILIAAGLMVGVGGVMTVAVAPTASAQLKDGIKKTKTSENSNTSVDKLVKSVVNILLYIIGIVAVIMIIVGGIQYATSSGDAGKAKTAKNTILYAVAGVVIALFAYAIVNFVVNRVS